MIRHFWLVFGTVGFGLAAIPAAAATVMAESVFFESTDRQSSTAPGTALSVAKTVRMTETWNVASPTVGSIATTTIRNPLRIAWDACKKADVFNTGVCGSAPRRTISTQNGATVQARTSGEAGFEVNAVLDAGSVAPTLSYGIEFRVPDRFEYRAGDYWYLAPNETLQAGELGLRSPTAKVTADVILGVSASANGRVCTTITGCSNFSLGLPSIGASEREIIDIDPNRIQYLEGFLPSGSTAETPLLNLRADLNVGVTPPYFNVSFNNALIPSLPAPLTGPIIDIANVEVTVPEYEVAGTLGSDRVVRASGQDDILDLRVDLDALIPGPRAGVKVEAGPVALSVDAYDIEGGPSVDLFQDVSLTPTLYVGLDFDADVFIDGLGLVRSYFGKWSSLPAMVFSGPTYVTPTYVARSVMRSVAGLQFGLELTIDVLKAAIEAPFLNREIGPLKRYQYAYNPNFLKATLFDSTFDFDGFDAVQGQTFLVDAFVNNPPPPPPPISPIPLPAPALLLTGALAGLSLLRFRGIRPA